MAVTESEHIGLATVRGLTASMGCFAARVRARLGVELPSGPYSVAAGAIRFAGIAPGEWLAIDENGANSLVVSLQQALGGLAMIVDQSDAYAVLRVSGAGVRDGLARIFPVDLHERAFRPGDVAATVGAYIHSILWRLEDGDVSPTFEVAIPRSFAVSFWHTLSQSLGG